VTQFRELDEKRSLLLEDGFHLACCTNVVFLDELEDFSTVFILQTASKPDSSR